jgi:hypothetical protein
VIRLSNECESASTVDTGDSPGERTIVNPEFYGIAGAEK